MISAKRLVALLLSDAAEESFVARAEERRWRGAVRKRWIDLGHGYRVLVISRPRRQEKAAA